VVNKKGELVQTAIKPGTKVHIYYANVAIHVWLIASSSIEHVLEYQQ